MKALAGGNGNAAEAADRAEALVTELDADLAALVAEEEAVGGAIAGAIARGAPIRDLAKDRDDLQRRIASRRQDLRSAEDAARAARLKAESARLALLVAAVDEATRASDEALEALLRKLAGAWAARVAPDGKVAALMGELTAARRRNRTMPWPAESGLTSDLLVLCESVGPALEVLAAEREAARERKGRGAWPASV